MTPGEDARSIANEMDDVADRVDSTGIEMEEYDDFGFPEEYKSRVALAMSHWETGGYHLREGYKVMRKVADEMREKEIKDAE